VTLLHPDSATVIPINTAASLPNETNPFVLVMFFPLNIQGKKKAPGLTCTPNHELRQTAFEASRFEFQLSQPDAVPVWPWSQSNSGRVPKPGGVTGQFHAIRKSSRRWCAKRETSARGCAMSALGRKLMPGNATPASSLLRDT
jgi:hypothetical protein